MPAANAARLLLAGLGLTQDTRLLGSCSRSGGRLELLQGPLVYVLALAAATLLAWRDHPAGLLAVALMSAGDGLAEVAGRLLGGSGSARRALPWNADKTWAGSAGMLLGGTAASMG